MKFETRRERETRRKRQKQSAILGMVLAFALVMIMGAVIWSGKRGTAAGAGGRTAEPV